MSEIDPNILSQIERDERWLAGMKTPAPSDECIAHIKRAVHEELRRGSATTHRRWWAGYGVFAAAAAIALAVWIGWPAAQSTPSITQAPAIVKRSAPAIAPVVAETEPAIATDDSLALVNEIDDTLSTLEDWSQDSAWDLSGKSLAEALDDVFSEPAKDNANRRGA